MKYNCVGCGIYMFVTLSHRLLSRHRCFRIGISHMHTDKLINLNIDKEPFTNSPANDHNHTQ